MGATSAFWALGQLFLAFLVILPLLYLTLRLAGRRVQEGRGGMLKVRASCFLGPGKGLHLVQLGERFFLIGTAEKEIRPLTAFRDPLLARALDETGREGERPPVSGAPWRDWFRKLRTRFQGGGTGEESGSKEDFSTLLAERILLLRKLRQEERKRWEREHEPVESREEK